MTFFNRIGLGMLPAAKKYLIAGNLSPQAAAYTTIGCFLGGVVAIQAVSRLLHHHIPSHTVDCDHSHEDEDLEGNTNAHGDAPHEHGHSPQQNGVVSDVTPLLSGEEAECKQILAQRPTSATSEVAAASSPPLTRESFDWRSSLQNRLAKQVGNLVLGSQASCDEDGPCFGFSDPCGQECFTGIHRSPAPAGSSLLRRPNPVRTATAPISQHKQWKLTGLEENSLPSSPRGLLQPGQEGQEIHQGREGYQTGVPFRSLPENQSIDEENNRSSDSLLLSGADTAHDASHQHHHHVPTNAFLAIGLQTSMAIALHKLPEGFITFATNHANPQLGFAIFMALFIHNITEGFAMALPLYLALGSRWKSMFWSSLLGGVSQPLGAGAAALWFKLAGRGDMAPGDTVYGCMFAVTAGVMTSVALQLFSESLSLTHSRQLCIAFAFIGMGILGLSFALTAV